MMLRIIDIISEFKVRILGFIVHLLLHNEPIYAIWISAYFPFRYVIHNDIASRFTFHVSRITVQTFAHNPLFYTSSTNRIACHIGTRLRKMFRTKHIGHLQ